MNSFSIRFLTRSGCHLCEDARPLVEWASGRAGVDLEVVDIDTSDELTARWGLRIPVVLGPDEGVIAEGRIVDRRSLLRALRVASRDR